MFLSCYVVLSYYHPNTLKGGFGSSSLAKSLSILFRQGSVGVEFELVEGLVKI